MSMQKLTKEQLAKAKLAVVDLDGNLFKTANFWSTINGRILKSVCGIDVNPREEFEVFLSCRNIEAYYDKVRANYGIKFSNEQLNAIMKSIACAHYSNIDYIPNADKFLHGLKRKQIPIVLATRCRDFALDVLKDQNKKVLDKADFYSTFDDIITLKDVNGSTDKSAMYKLACMRAKTDPLSTLGFEDDLSGAIGCYDAGIPLVANMAGGETSSEEQLEMAKIATYFVTDYSDIIL